MALDVTIGGASSDAYVDLSVAQTRATADGLFWTGDDATKEIALRRATSYVDARYGSRFRGYRLNGRGQALEWPRSGATDNAGWAIPNDEIPVEIIRATVIAASRELASPNSLAPDVDLSQQLETEKYEGVEFRYNTDLAPADGRSPLSAVEDEMLGLVIQAPRRGTSVATTTSLVRG